MPTEDHTYRIPFVRLFLAMLVVGQSVFWLFMGLALLLGVVIPGGRITLGAEFVGMVAASVISTLLMAPAALWMKLALPVRVSPDSFSCPNGFGKMVTVPWGAIRDVKSFNLPGMPYLLVRTDRTRLKLWLPLFLREMPEFVEKVEQFAGQDHVLYQALWPQAEQM
jgi:hypothetical protein